MLSTQHSREPSACDLQLFECDRRGRRRRGLAIRWLVLALLWAPLHAATTEWAAPVFMYHRFGEDLYPSTSVPLARFDQQLDWLQAQGFEVWPLSRLMQAWERGVAPPEKVVSITVDDAYASVYHEGWPRLRERGFALTVFVATDAVDRGFRDMMSWAQMRELRDQGVEFANHSVSHDALQRLRVGETPAQWRERVRHEIEHAQLRLQQELGAQTNHAPKLFAYPYGEYSLPLMQLLAELGYLAFGQHSGVIGVHSAPQALPRYPINTEYGDAADFALKARSLPLPVIEQQPLDPVVGAENPPQLELRIGESRARLAQLACYASGQGRVPVVPTSSDSDRYRVEAPSVMPKGRSRYNCTAPHDSANRWYWYSQLWIVD